MNIISEKDRFDLFQKQRFRLKSSGGCEINLLFTFFSQYTAAFVLSMPFSIGSFLGFGLDKINSFIYRSNFLTLVYILIALCFCFAVHELLHGIFWGMFTGRRLKSLNVWISLCRHAVMCQVKESLPLGGFIFGLCAPAVLMIAFPIAAAYVRNDVFLFLIGACNIPVCGDDGVTLLNVLKASYGHRGCRVLIHPQKSGCLLYTQKRPDN